MEAALLASLVPWYAIRRSIDGAVEDITSRRKECTTGAVLSLVHMTMHDYSTVVEVSILMTTWMHIMLHRSG